SGAPSQVISGDLNHDAKQDLVVANFNDNNVGVFISGDNGAFESQVTYPTAVNPTGVAIGDFNGDGVPDLAVSSLDATEFSILLGKGDGTFDTATDTPLEGFGPAFSVVTADVRHNGKTDLIFAYPSANKIVVLLGNGDSGATFQGPVAYTVGQEPQAVAVADINGDGIPDIVASNFNDDTISVLTGVGNGSFNITPAKYEKCLK